MGSYGLEEWLSNPKFKAKYEEDKPMMDFKHDLLEARIKSGKSYEEIGKVMGESRDYVGRFERPPFNNRDLFLHLSYAKAIGLTEIKIKVDGK